jgi:hypothetical protein
MIVSLCFAKLQLRLGCINQNEMGSSEYAEDYSKIFKTESIFVAICHVYFGCADTINNFVRESQTCPTMPPAIDCHIHG